MGLESIFDKQTNLEVGPSDSPPVPIPGVSPMQGTLARKGGMPGDMLDYIRKQVKQAETDVVNPWRDRAITCYRFRDNNQLDDITRQELKAARRPDTAFNQLQKYIRYVAGNERRSPQALLFNPNVIDNDQQQILGSFLTDCYQWALNKCGGAYERSRAFEDMLTAGMGWVNTWIDKLRDPRGMIQHERVPPMEMYWPQCASENLKTTRWRARESYIDKEDALRRWPDQRSLILARSEGRDSGTDGANPFSPQQDFTRYTIYPIDTVPVDKAGRAETSKKGKCKVLEFQWYDDEDGFTFPDPVTGEPVWMSESEFRKYHRKLEVLLPEIGAMLKQRSDKVVHRVCRVMHVLDRQFALDEPRRLPGDRFTLNCMTGHYDEDLKLWYGYVQILMDPQRYANKFFNQVIEIMGTTAKSGVMAQSDAFDETAPMTDFQQNYAQAGSLSMVAPEAIEKGKILPKIPPQLPQGAMAIVEFCVQSMSTVSGFDTAGIGLDAGGAQQPGVTVEQKLTVSRVMMAQEFDALHRYRIEDEGPVIVAHLALIADGRFIRIGGPEAQQVVPLLREPFLLETELQLDDSEPEPTQRKKFQGLIERIGPMLAKLGLIVPSMFNYVDLPWKVRRDMVQQMQAQKQQQEQAAAMGINIKGRGAPRTPQEVQAKVMDMQARATMHQARAKAMLAESRREDLRTVIDTIKGFQQQGIERDRLSLEEQRHGLEHQRHGLDHAKHRLDHGKAIADTAIRLLEAMNPEPQNTGREE